MQVRLAGAERAASLAATRLAPLGTSATRERRGFLDAAARALAALGPEATLARGYAIVRDAGGAVLRDAADTTPGASVGITLARGVLDARITAVRDSGT